MTSDFAAARGHLDLAQHCLHGNDDISLEVRHAIDLLLEAVITAEHRKPDAKILVFRQRKARQ